MGWAALCVKSHQYEITPATDVYSSIVFSSPPRKKSLMLKKFAISFLEEREAFPLWCLQFNLLSIDCYLLRSRQAELHPPAESISLFVMALLESVLLETKLHSANGLRVTGADIRAIMISLCVYMHRWSVCDMGLWSNHSDHTWRTMILTKLRCHLYSFGTGSVRITYTDPSVSGTSDCCFQNAS